MDDKAQRIREAFGVVACVLIDIAESDPDDHVDLEDAFMAQSMLAAAIQAETAFRLGENDKGALSFMELDDETELDAREVEPACDCDGCRAIRLKYN